MSEELARYLRYHHPDGLPLHQIEWLIFGVIGFDKELKQKTTSRWEFIDKIWRLLHIDNQSKRQSKVSGLMLSLARHYNIKSQDLIWFVSYEVTPENRYHHAHILIGVDGINKSAEDVCRFLYKKTSEFGGFGDCHFVEFDPTQDGIGYVTKRNWTEDEEDIPIFHKSKGLRRLLNKLEGGND